MKTLLAIILLAAIAYAQEPAKSAEKPAETKIELSKEEKADFDKLMAERIQVLIELERAQAHQREFELKAENLRLRASLRVKCDDCSLNGDGTLTKTPPAADKVKADTQPEAKPAGNTVSSPTKQADPVLQR